MKNLPETGFLRIHHILGDPKRGIYPLFPVSRAEWYQGIKEGRYPEPVKIAPRVTVWRTSDILKLINQVEGE